MELLPLLYSAGYDDAAEIQKISGGDINSAYSFSAAGRNYFVKLNSASKYPNLFHNEANGLKEISKKSNFKIPEIVKIGHFENIQFLIMEFLEAGTATKDSWFHFGKNLATLHGVSQEHFGFYEDNYLGTQKQDNSLSASWPDFYTANRLLPSIRQMFDKGLADKKDVRKLENLCSKLGEIYPEERPSLLHGDLWNGNYHILKSGEITVIDPACYYGHREMDLAMCLLFGGFPQEFYSHYFTDFPVQPGFENRVEVSQLYYLIFHAIRFKSSYISSVKTILNKFG